MTATIAIHSHRIGADNDLLLFAGPCVIESRDKCLAIARALHDWTTAEAVPLVFKASYDKANRTSIDSFRGPGLEQGLEILAEVRAETGLPLLTDVHSPEQATRAGAVVDVLQIPAFLCRQTDLLVAAGETGKVVKIKKGQFLAPEDMVHAVRKVESTGNHNILLTERGASFGYRNLVADMRSLLILAELGYPVVFDATHSVQRPGSGDGRTGGDGRWAPNLARAAVATGCNGLFIETHLNPEEALSDKDNAIPFAQLPALWRQLQGIHTIIRGTHE